MDARLQYYHTPNYGAVLVVACSQDGVQKDLDGHSHQILSLEQQIGDSHAEVSSRMDAVDSHVSASQKAAAEVGSVRVLTFKSMT
jgi:hypothetical protein